MLSLCQLFARPDEQSEQELFKIFCFAFAAAVGFVFFQIIWIVFFQHQRRKGIELIAQIFHLFANVLHIDIVYMIPAADHHVYALAGELRFDQSVKIIALAKKSDESVFIGAGAWDFFQMIADMEGEGDVVIRIIGLLIADIRHLFGFQIDVNLNVFNILDRTVIKFAKQKSIDHMEKIARMTLIIPDSIVSNMQGFTLNFSAIIHEFWFMFIVIWLIEDWLVLFDQL